MGVLLLDYFLKLNRYIILTHTLAGTHISYFKREVTDDVVSMYAKIEYQKNKMTRDTKIIFIIDIFYAPFS